MSTKAEQCEYDDACYCVIIMEYNMRMCARSRGKIHVCVYTDTVQYMFELHDNSRR